MKIRWKRQFEEVIFKISQLQYRTMYLNCVKELKLKYTTNL